MEAATQLAPPVVAVMVVHNPGEWFDEVLDAYAYRTLVWDIYVERVSAPRRGRAADEALIAAALPKAQTCLVALEDIMGEAPFLAGETLSLADLHAAPMIALFRMASEGSDLLLRHGRLGRWWEAMAARPSMVDTWPATAKSE